MAVKDLEIPYYRQPLGAVSSYTLDFSAVLPTGQIIGDYEVEVRTAGILSHVPAASIKSASTILIALKAENPGETLVTVWAMPAHKTGETTTQNGLREPLQLRLLVET